MIVCSKCRMPKPESEFNRHATSKTGYQYRCRSCQAKINARQRNATGWRGPTGRLPGKVWRNL